MDMTKTVEQRRLGLFLWDVKRLRPLAHKLVLCQAKDMAMDRGVIVFWFNHSAIVDEFSQLRPWLVDLARKHFGESCDVGAEWAH